MSDPQTQPKRAMQLLKPMLARDRDDSHRAATPLELIFDLVSVIAIAAIAGAFHHAISDGHGLEALPRFLIFFATIWWAWMNFTWFASAFDNDDLPYRIAVLVLIGGATIFAGAVSYAFKTLDLTVCLVGWVIMRLAMVFLWLRAARHNREHAKTAYRYAYGLIFVQILWAVLILAPIYQTNIPVFLGLCAALFLLEMGIVVFAESAGGSPWHRHHIIERFGLLNIIVLGEVLLAISLAVGYGAKEHFSIELIILIVCAIVAVFCMWWLYFIEVDHLVEGGKTDTFVWGYGHFFIYAAGAAEGAGIGALVDVASHHSKIDLAAAQVAATLPISIYILGLWLVRDRHYLTSTSGVLMLAAVIMIALTNFTGFALPLSVVILVLLLGYRLRIG